MESITNDEINNNLKSWDNVKIRNKRPAYFDKVKMDIHIIEPMLGDSNYIRFNAK